MEERRVGSRSRSRHGTRSKTKGKAIVTDNKSKASSRPDPNINPIPSPSFFSLGKKLSPKDQKILNTRKTQIQKRIKFKE